MIVRCRFTIVRDRINGHLLGSHDRIEKHAWLEVYNCREVAQLKCCKTARRGSNGTEAQKVVGTD